MRLQSVRDLKQEAVEVVRRSIADGQGARPGDQPAVATRRARGPAPTVALGITMTTKAADGYGLAVRLQDRSVERNVRALAALTDLSRGELDISYVGSVRPLWTRNRHRPFRIGSSVAHHEITAGTIGGFPRRRADGGRVLLSNAHVLAQDGLAAVGDDILQPGPADSGRRLGDRAGGLLEFVPLDTNGPNRVDAAICSVGDGGVEKTNLTGFGYLRGARPEPADIGEIVNKIGRTTDLTHGRVTAIEVDDLIVDMEQIGRTRFDGQIEIEGSADQVFSEGGDSGSLVFDAHGWAVGLLFAGSDQGGQYGRGLTYANDIHAVLEALDLELDV